MLPGMELMGCQGLAVPSEVMHHVVRVESSYNPYAIGVVGGRLVRQPKNLPEALSTVRMLESRGYNFSIGLAQVNRYNLDKYGLESYERAFEPCANLKAGSKILAECYRRASGDWGKSFSCYYSGNFSTGFRHGYVQKIYASLRQSRGGEAAPASPAIEVVGREARRTVPVSRHPVYANGEAPPAPAAAGAAPVVQAAYATTAPSRTDRIRARSVPIERTVPVAEPGMATQAELDMLAAAPAQIPAQAPALPQDMGRAVPTYEAEVARAVVAEAAPAPVASAPAKRRDRSSDKAFIVTDPAQDDAFVF